MRFHRGTITELRPLPFEEDLSYGEDAFARSYPLVGLKDVHVSGEVFREKKTVGIYLRVEALATVIDARSAKPIQWPLDYEDEFALLSSFDSEEEGYVYEQDPLDLSEVVFHSIVSHIPRNASAEDSSLPRSGEGYGVYSEDEELPKEPNPFERAFAAEEK